MSRIEFSIIGLFAEVQRHEENVCVVQEEL